MGDVRVERRLSPLVCQGAGRRIRPSTLRCPQEGVDLDYQDSTPEQFRTRYIQDGDDPNLTARRQRLGLDIRAEVYPDSDALIPPAIMATVASDARDRNLIRRGAMAY